MLTALKALMAGGILFLLPFFCFPYGSDMELQFQVPKLMGAYMLGNILFSFYLSERIHLAFGLVHFAFSTSVLLTGFGGMQLYPFVYWLAGVFFALWTVEQHQGTKLFIWQAIAASGLLVAIHATLQMLGFTWPLHYAADIDPRTPIALFGQQTKLGSFLAPSAAVAMAVGWWPVSLFIALIAICTKSSMTIFALFCGMATVWCQWRRRWFFSVRAAIVVGLVGIVAGPYFNKTVGGVFDDHGRHFVYNDTISAWWEKPLLGYGPGSFKALYAGPDRHKTPVTKDSFKHSIQTWYSFSVGGGWFEQAHNDYVQALFEFGAFGFSALLIALIMIFCAYRTMLSAGHYGLRMECAEWKINLAAQGALAAMLANALGNFPWLLSPHFVIGLLGAAILLRSSRD